MPWLWILTPSASENLLAQLDVSGDADWLPGIYFDRADRTALIAINQLPCTEETLWVRLLGRGKTQERAISEVLAFPTTDPRRLDTLQLLVTWKISLEVTNLVQQEENDVMVQLSQVYLEWEQQTQQQGVERGERMMVLRLLTRKVGELPAEVRSQIDLLTIPQLESLGEALLDFADFADLTLWLAAQA